jgi:four helix bundle protein
MATFSRFEEIKAWQLARKLTVEVYVISKKAPFNQDFELKGQIRAASGSIMHNIAEGFDAGSDSEFVRFLGMARRSASEVRSELYVALDQAYITDSEFQQLTDLAMQCRNTINGLIDYLKKNANSKIQTPQSKLK